MADLGFVGLGTMGSRVAKRLLDAGYDVTGYNRTKEKAEWLLDAGMVWGDSPRLVAQESNVVFSMVSDTRALHAITAGEHGIIAGLRPGSIYIDMSTVSPAVSRSVAEHIDRTGSRMLDAPVSGSVTTLEEGNLSIMVGGEHDIYERALEYLEVIGRKVTYVGPNGLAVTMKIATNLSLATQMVAFSEGVLIAERAGIPREVAVEALLNSVMASPMVKYRGPFVLEMPEDPWFDVNMMQKDLQLALELGKQLNVPLPTTGLSNELLTAARSMGYAEQDFAALFDVLANMAGVEPRPSREVSP